MTWRAGGLGARIRPASTSSGSPARSEEPTGTANQLTQIPQMGVNGQIVSPSAGVPNTLPAGMSPMPDADKAPAPADDPWAFLSEPGTLAQR